ncbi:MAG: class I SAM-dependent methyltransferase [Alphaproteobacteria bacterium]|nr:class I SAM-dependent methyltransferase [Alphaproteobacteria bacterium]MBN2779512.1 class I SAM-dependent methyltransferase [Alphaproteobacteria bacterium]
MEDLAYKNKSMAEYWIKMIRESRDDFRTYVTDPAIFSELKKLPKGSTVLDAGCGEGYISRFLVNEGYSVTGIDLSEEFIQSAQKARAKDEVYMVSDILKADFEPNHFDAIVLNHVMMELKNPEKAIERFGKWLKPGGKLIFLIVHPFNDKTSEMTRENKYTENYFEVQKRAEKFLIKGLETPEKLVWYHHPLKTYTESLYKNNFLIESLQEPSFIDSTPQNHKLREILKDPWFLLFVAKKEKI